MANKISPRGFVPLRYLSGAAWNGASNMYCVPSTDGTIISVGDAVKSAAGGDANGIPYIAKAAGTDVVRGVVVGILPDSPNNPSLVGTNLDLTLQNMPATKTKAYYVLVVDDPMVIFDLEDDGAAALDATACNKNAIFVVTNPTAPSQVSASTLSAASVAVTATLNLKLMGLVQKPDNAYGVNANWAVMFNLHELNRGGTAGL
jgi:hypothetical protein